jgi:nucleoporin NDC1
MLTGIVVLWSWFPLGVAGFRTVLLFACGFAVIVLRVAQYHVGLRTSTSGFETFIQHALKMQTAEAIVTYTVSAVIFSQVYLACLPRQAGLDWLIYFTEARVRLNERPLFLTAHFLILGAIQGITHLYQDHDKLVLEIARTQDKNGHASNGASAHVRRFLDQMPVVFITAVNQSVAGVMCTIIIYPIFLRGPFWRASVMFLRPFLTLPKTNMLPTTVPYSFWTLFRCFCGSFMLVFLWTAGNVAFSVFLARDPLKHGKPLTEESKDKNGSLINGLKSKKLSIKVRRRRHPTWSFASTLLLDN